MKKMVFLITIFIGLSSLAHARDLCELYLSGADGDLAARVATSYEKMLRTEVGARLTIQQLQKLMSNPFELEASSPETHVLKEGLGKLRAFIEGRLELEKIKTELGKILEKLITERAIQTHEQERADEVRTQVSTLFREFEASKGRVLGAYFTSDKDVVVIEETVERSQSSSNEVTQLRIFNLKTGQKGGAFGRGIDNIQQVSEDTWIGTKDRKEGVSTSLHIYKIKNGKVTTRKIQFSKKSAILSFKVFPDKKRVLILLKNGVFQISEIQTGQLFKELDTPLKAIQRRLYRLHPDYIYYISRDGQFIAFIYNNNEASGNSVKVWSVAEKKVVFSSNSVRIKRKLFEFTGNVFSTPDGNHYILASAETNNGTKTVAIPIDAQPNAPKSKKSPTQKYFISGDIEVFSQDKSLVLTEVSNWRKKIWDVQTGRLVSKLEYVPAALQIIQFSPNNKYLIATTRSGGLVIWDVQTGRRLFQKTEDEFFYYSCGFSFSSSGDQIILYEITSGKIMLIDLKALEEEVLNTAKK